MNLGELRVIDEHTLRELAQLQSENATLRAKLEEATSWINGAKYVLVGHEVCFNRCGGCRDAAKEILKALEDLK